MISPLLFSIYIDNLFKELKQLGLGCHVGPIFAGAFGYADDVAWIARHCMHWKKMISLCESYEERYHITFNPIISKLICYNIDPSTLGPICLYKQPIGIVMLIIISTLEIRYLMIFMTEIMHLVFVIFINEAIAQFQTGTLCHFSACNSDTLDRLHSSFCMHMYSCEL